jgi:hypothetical protein
VRGITVDGPSATSASTARWRTAVRPRLHGSWWSWRRESNPRSWCWWAARATAGAGPSWNRLPGMQPGTQPVPGGMSTGMRADSPSLGWEFCSSVPLDAFQDPRLIPGDVVVFVALAG